MSMYLKVICKKNLWDRSAGMERESCGILAVVGDPRVLPGRRQAAAVLYAGKGHLCYGQGSLPGESSPLHGGHPLGTPGNITEG